MILHQDGNSSGLPLRSVVKPQEMTGQMKPVGPGPRLLLRIEHEDPHSHLCFNCATQSVCQSHKV